MSEFNPKQKKQNKAKPKPNDLALPAPAQSKQLSPKQQLAKMMLETAIKANQEERKALFSEAEKENLSVFNVGEFITKRIPSILQAVGKKDVKIEMFTYNSVEGFKAGTFLNEGITLEVFTGRSARTTSNRKGMSLLEDIRDTISGDPAKADDDERIRKMATEDALKLKEKLAAEAAVGCSADTKRIVFVYVGLNALETSLGMLDDAQKDKNAIIVTVMCSCDLSTKMSEVKSKMKNGRINSAVVCSCGGDSALGEIARAFITRCKIRNCIDGKTKFLQKEASKMQKAFSKDKKSFSLIADAKLEMIKKNGNEVNKVMRLLKKVDTANTLELQKIIAKITDFGAFIALTPLMHAMESEFVGVQLSAVTAAKAVARKAYADCDTVDVAALIPLLNRMAEVGKDAKNEDLIAAIVDASAVIVNGFEKKK